jgi:hypothetical protein
MGILGDILGILAGSGGQSGSYSVSKGGKSANGWFPIKTAIFL